MRFFLSLLCVLCLAGIAGNATAAVVAEYDIAAANAFTSSSVNVASASANTTASTMDAVGALGSAFDFASTFCYLDHPTGAIDLTRYYEFTITPDAGFGVIYEDVDFSIASGGTGTVSVQIRSSVDGYASTLDSSSFPADATWYVRTLDISSLGGVIPPVTFRLYQYNAPSSGFTGLGSAGAFGPGGQNFFVNGEVVEESVSTVAVSWGKVKTLFE